MKKVISFILCLVFILLSVSCSSAEPEIVPEYDSSISEESVDLDGKTLIMGINPMSYYESENSTLTYINDTEFGDLAAERIKEIESKYDCKIEFDYISGPGAIAFNNAIAGTYVFDFVLDESYYLVDYMNANAFQDLTALDNIDVFDETKWGSKYLRIPTMNDGAIFGLLPNAHPMRTSVSIDNLVLINENLITDISATDPRDYFENGEWNWDTFTECLKTYAHTSGISNEYVYSMASGFGNFARGLAMSNGVEFMTINENGNIKQLGYFTQEATDAYNKAFEWYFGETKDNILSVGSGADLYNTFTEGRAVLHYTSANAILTKTSSVAYVMDNFGFVPTPVGPNAESQDDYKTSYCTTIFTLAIPLTAKDPETSAFILDKMYAPFEGYETQESVIDYLAKNYFRDRRDAELYVKMSDGNHVWYHPSRHDFSTMADQMPNTGVAKGMQSYEESLMRNAEKYILSAYETLLQYDEFFHE